MLLLIVKNTDWNYNRQEIYNPGKCLDGKNNYKISIQPKLRYQIYNEHTAL